MCKKSNANSQKGFFVLEISLKKGRLKILKLIKYLIMKKLFSKVCTEKHCKIIECLFDFRYTRKNVENVLNSQKNRKLC